MESNVDIERTFKTGRMIGLVLTGSCFILPLILYGYLCLKTSGKGPDGMDFTNLFLWVIGILLIPFIGGLAAPFVGLLKNTKNNNRAPGNKKHFVAADIIMGFELWVLSEALVFESTTALTIWILFFMASVVGIYKIATTEETETKQNMTEKNGD